MKPKRLDMQKDSQRLQERDMSEHERIAGKFIRLIAEHGRFQMRQLWRYVELRAGKELTVPERHGLRRYVENLGAKSDRSMEIEVFVLPTSMRLRTGGRSKREDRACGDLFGGK